MKVVTDQSPLSKTMIPLQRKPKLSLKELENENTLKQDLQAIAHLAQGLKAKQLYPNLRMDNSIN